MATHKVSTSDRVLNVLHKDPNRRRKIVIGVAVVCVSAVLLSVVALCLSCCKGVAAGAGGPFLVGPRYKRSVEDTNGRYPAARGGGPGPRRKRPTVGYTNMKPSHIPMFGITKIAKGQSFTRS